MIVGILTRFIFVVSKLIARLFEPKVSNYDKKAVKKILIYGVPGIGNTILYTPALKLFRECFPEAEISFVNWTLRPSHSILCKSGFLDKIIVLDSLVKKIGFLFKVSNMHYDMVVHNFLNQSFLPIFLTVFSKAPLRLGHVSGREWQSPWGRFYNLKAIMPEHAHEIEVYLALLEPLGCMVSDYDRKPSVFLADKDKVYIDKVLHEYRIDSGHICIGIQVDVNLRQQWKRWPVQKIRDLCLRLKQIPNYRIILLGKNLSHKDGLVLDEIGQGIINLVGKTSLCQTAQIIARCKIIITPDSGLMHLAAALGIKTLVLYGPTDSVRTAPYGSGHKIIRKAYECIGCYRHLTPFKEMQIGRCRYKHRCMHDITVKEVFDVMVDMIQE